MQTNTKRSALLLAIVMFVVALFTALAGLFVVKSASAPAYAAPASTNGKTYYYNELENSALAQTFYGVIEEMVENGSLKNGVTEYDITSKVSDSELSDYLDKSMPKIPVAFGAARDAFFMDHPELFYIDVYKLYLTAGMKNGKNFLSVGTGRAENYYTDNTFTAEAQVTQAITEFDKAVDAAVSAAKADAADIAGQVRNVNEYMTGKIKYDYTLGASKNAAGDIVYNGNIYTAYGALVQNLAVCDGISKAFKVVMDELGIPCVTVRGSVSSGVVGKKDANGLSSHSWNAVEIDGLWYGVDVTYNCGAVNSDKFTLVGDDFLSIDHFEDGVISSSGFELKYPKLRPFDYGVAEDANGFGIADSGKIGKTELGYTEYKTGTTDLVYLTLGVGFNGKDAVALKEEGKYIAYRSKSDPTGEWYPWIGVAAIAEVSGYTSENGYTPVQINPEISQVQFGVIDYPPDTADMLDYKIIYSPDKLTESNIVALSTVYTNNAYGKYSRAPYVSKVTPDEKGYIKSFEPIEVELTYSEKLVALDGSETDRNYKVEIAVRGSKGDAIENSVSNVKWDPAEKKLSFTFAPIKSFSRNCETYNFTPVNLKGAESGKLPEPGGYLSFSRKHVICPKVFNDGRLYMKVFGQPQFVSAADESIGGFKDQNGQPIVGDQRSQLMLVVNEPDKAESDAMKNAAKDQFGLTDNDVKASATYQIDLQICGVVQQVPEGSFMQVGFGFPDGYGPENAGVTFTCYHYTRNPDGTVKDVQEVPCVVTECGIIATVKSFSPFMICAIDSSKAGKTKNVYATVDGIGGTIENAEIRQVKEGENVTFKLKKESGYNIDKVLLNGTDIKNKVGADGALTLTYAELTGNSVNGKSYVNNNVLEVTYISERVEKYNNENNIVVKTPKIVVTQNDMIIASDGVAGKPLPGKNNTALIVGIVVPLVILILAGCGVALFFILRNKKQQQPSASGKSPSSTNTATRPTNTNATNRPTNTATRPTNTNASSRPTNTATRPTNTNASSRPTNTATRSTNPNASSRPTNTATRPTNTNASSRPTANRPSAPGNASRPASRPNTTDKNKK